MEKISSSFLIFFSVAFLLTYYPEVKVAKTNLSDENKKSVNLALNKSYIVNVDSDSPHLDSGYQLTDGIKGSVDVSDEAWVGFYDDPTREIIIDLEQMQSIESIHAGFLQSPNEAIRYPNTIAFYVSDDGEKWALLKHDSSPVAFWLNNPPKHTFKWESSVDGLVNESLQSESIYARYVKIRIQTNTKVLIDEIEVFGKIGKDDHAKIPEYIESTYLSPGSGTNHISDLILLYNGHYSDGRGIWSKDNIIPYIAYVDENGKPLDWFFDGVLYLGLSSPDGRAFEMHRNGSNLKDWTWYLDKTFGSGGDLDELNEAVKEVELELGKLDEKYPVVLMIPYTARRMADFGDIDGSGESLNFFVDDVGEEKALENQKKAITWYIEEVMKRWNEKNYSNIELAGLYWLNEEVAPDAVDDFSLINHAGSLVKEHGKKFYWIPRYQGFGISTWKDLGFDAVALQPNHFFTDGNPASRIDDAARWAKDLGIGVEIEVDDRIFDDQEAYTRYLNYLNGGKYHNYNKDTFKAYYQGGNTFLQAARSLDPEKRNIYDITYKFVSGLEILPEKPELKDVTLEVDSISLLQGEKIDPMISGILSDGSKLDITKATVDWVVSNPQVVEFNKGQLEAKNAGKADIYVLVTLNGTEVASNIITVTVKVTAATLTNQIDRLEKGGFIKNSLKKQLTNGLKQVEHHYKKGNVHQAKKHLRDMIKHIEKSEHSDSWVEQLTYNIHSLENDF